MADSTPQFGDRGHLVLAVTIALLVASTFFIILRFISRIGIVKRVSADDYAIVVAWFIAFGFSFSICYGTSVGLGWHQANVKPQWEHMLKKSEYGFSVLYNPALMATKTSICLFYLTLSKNQRVFRWTTVSTLVVVNTAGAALTLLNIFQCRPVGAAFDFPLPSDDKCIDIVTLYLSSAPVNIITDLALLFLPMPILTGMKLPRNEKLILIVTFSFGAFVAVIDVVRIAYLQSASLAQLQKHTGSDVGSARDFSWIASLSFMWSAVEVHVGIIVACVPGVKPLVVKIFPTLLGRIRHVGDLTGSKYYGPGESQWANVGPPRLEHRTHSGHVSPNLANRPRSRGHDRGMSVDGVLDLTLSNDPGPADIPTNANGVGHSGQVGNNQTLDFLTTPDTIHTHAANGHPDHKDENVNMLDFLTSQDAGAPAENTKSVNTTNTLKSRGNLAGLEYFNVKSRKSMVKMTNRESIGPLCLVTILFFLWGFAYGLLDVLNSQFQLIIRVSTGQSIGLHSAYFGAYFVAPLTFGQVIFKKWGFKATFMTGLCIYGCGTLVFWPSAVLASFPAFLISNFIVGLGVSTLEVAGNPFIALCGPPEYAEVRLNLSQAVQAVGSVLSPILAQKALFKDVHDAPRLINIQWTYLGIALFVVILALIYYYLPIPEASDKDLEEVAQRRASVNEKQVGRGLRVVYLTLALGVFSQFCYVGGQESVSVMFQQYIDTVKPKSKIGAFYYQAIGHTVFAVGRFLSALAGLLIPPRWILLFLFTGLIVTSALAMNLTGYAGISMIILVYFFESGIFSIIFAMSLRGLGVYTKMGSVFLTAAISGGAVIPGIMSPVTSSRGVRYSFCVVVAVFAFGTLLPLYTILVPAAKQQVDPVHIPRDGSSSSERPKPPSRLSQAFSAVVRRKKCSSDLPTTEHLERKQETWPG